MTRNPLKSQNVNSILLETQIQNIQLQPMGKPARIISQSDLREIIVGRNLARIRNNRNNNNNNHQRHLFYAFVQISIFSSIFTCTSSWPSFPLLFGNGIELRFRLYNANPFMYKLVRCFLHCYQHNNCCHLSIHIIAILIAMCVEVNIHIGYVVMNNCQKVVESLINVFKHTEFTFEWQNKNLRHE